MKHFYTFLMVLAMTFGVSVPSWALSFNVEVNDPEAVTVSWDKTTEYPVPSNGIVTITADEGGSVYVTPKDGYFIDHYINFDGKTVTPYNVNNPVSVFVGESRDGLTLSFFVEKWEAIRTATATVNVVNGADDFTLTLGNTAIPLKDGSQTIKFSPEKESSFTIAPKSWNTPIYSVTLNGVPVESNKYYVQYSGTLTDGATLEIQMTEQTVVKEMVSVAFQFEDKGQDALAMVWNQTRSERITLEDNKCEVEKDTRIRLSLNIDDYNIDLLTVNGQPETVSQDFGTCTFEATEDMTVLIKASEPEYEDITFNITIVNPEGLLLYAGSMRDGQRIALENGIPADAFTMNVTSTDDSGATAIRTIEVSEGEAMTFTVSISSKNPFVTYTPADGYYLEAATGADLSTPLASPAYASEAPLYFILRKIERTAKAAIYLDGVPSNYRMADANSRNYTLAEGYTLINFDPSFDNPFKIQPIAATASSSFVYLNGTRVALNTENNAWSGLSLTEDAVLKIFASAPATYAITFEVADGCSAAVTADYVTPCGNLSEPISVLQGTYLTIEPAANTYVIVNGTDAEPDADGKYALTADQNYTVKLSKNTAGVASAITGDENNGKVYNLQGICVGENLRNLPAGIYIQAGKKVIKK